MILQASETPSPRKMFFNEREALLWIVIATFGVLTFAIQYRGLLGLFGAALTLFALQAAVSTLISIRIGEDCITLPRTLLKQIPILVFGRKKILFAMIQDVTFVGRFMGFDAVMLGTADGMVPVLFASRDRRRAFFDALAARRPEIRIYRAVT